MLEIPDFNGFVFGASQYVPLKTIDEREERPDGTLVIRKTITEVEMDQIVRFIDEMIIFPNDGKILSSNNDLTIKLIYIHTEYDMNLKPYRVQMKKIISRINHDDIEDFYHFLVYHEDDGSVYTEDTYLPSGGSLMNRKYVPVSNEEPIQFVDGVFVNAELVEEIQI